ncbi:MAG TPA: hypothetical protein VK995_03620 [Oceanipulchritudo sp.]|nr:hypothetical protein [Oceanipulchritudo sp.]
MNKAVLLTIGLLSGLVPITTSLAEEKSDAAHMKLPPVRSIPGLTAEDPFPRACVDCHIELPEQNEDQRISTLMANWTKEVRPQLLEKSQAFTPEGITLKGVHPKAASSLKDIPAACFSCHEKMAKKVPALVPLLHSIHLTGGESSHYLTIFQGECTHCHKLDKETGTWSVPSGPEKAEQKE